VGWTGVATLGRTPRYARARLAPKAEAVIAIVVDVEGDRWECLNVGNNQVLESNAISLC